MLSETVSKIYRVGSYSRISNEDIDLMQSDKGESSSISNQKALIEDYLKDKADLKLVKVYADDGVSGSSFSRPYFDRMMEDIECGIIDCVIVKDLSRFGREYIEAGNLLERVFPRLGVRFISINDNVDTLYGMDSLVVALKNIMNDAYCRDISIKTRSHLATRRAHGEFIGAFAIYGYEKDPKNHNRLIIDEYAGHIVQCIFRWKIQGMSCNGIADKLNDMDVLSPYDYKIKNGLLYSTTFKSNEKCLWSAVTVRRILENENYTGTLVQGKWTTPNHKVKKALKKDEEQWTKVNDRHEPLVSKRDFELVQKSLLLDTRTPAGAEYCYPLSGIMTCADCGASMVRRPRKIDGKIYVYFDCQEYFSSHQKHCHCHAVREDKVEQLVLQAIQCQIDLVLKIDECLKYLDLTMLTEMDRKRLNRQIEIHSADVEKYKNLIRHAYEDLYSQVLTQDEYMSFRDEFEIKKRTAEKSLYEVKNELEKVNNKTSRHYKWVEHFIRYQNVEELTREMVIELIDSIVIYDKKHIEITLAYQDEYNEAIQMLKELFDENDEKVVTACG